MLTLSLEVTAKYIGVFCEVRTKYTKLPAKNLIVIPEADESQQQITAQLRVVTDRPTSLIEGGVHFKPNIGVGKNKIVVMGSCGTQNPELLCWRRPATYYCAALHCSSL
jgi:hypothetical protein